MSDQAGRVLSLRELELEVEAEGREWMRRRLEARLQREADRDPAVFPPQKPKEGAASAPKGAAAPERRRRG